MRLHRMWPIKKIGIARKMKKFKAQNDIQNQVKLQLPNPTS